MTAARLIVDPPASGAWNMAVDEALLMSAAANQQASLRFYLWEQATVSLGYFQAYEQRKLHGASRQCPLVRRATGGGAIVHDRELTYSFTSPISDRVSADVQRLFHTFHRSLREALSFWGIETSLQASPGRELPHGEPFLCFQRRAAGDLLAGAVKIAGSAQRRHKGGVLQHGSVLLQTSASAPELMGIDEICGIRLEPRELLERWTILLGLQLGLEFQTQGLGSSEQAAALTLAQEKFGSELWSHRR